MTLSDDMHKVFVPKAEPGVNRDRVRWCIDRYGLYGIQWFYDFSTPSMGSDWYFVNEEDAIMFALTWA